MNIVRAITKMIKRAVDAALADVHTHLPCQVVEYDEVRNMVSLQPCIKRMRIDDPDNESVRLPVIEDVPVQQFGSGKLLVSVAPQAGSYGVLHVTERSINNWLSKGGVELPDTFHKFDYNDGFFEPGAYPLVVDGDNGKLQGAVETDRLSMRTRSGDTQISVLDDDTVHIENPSTTIVIDSSGNTTITGSKLILNDETDAVGLGSKIDLLWTKLDTVLRTAWVIPPAPDSGAALKAAYLAAFATPPTTVASTKMKLDA